MTPTEAKRLQTNLRVVADGAIGPKTLAALFMRAGSAAERADTMGKAAATAFVSRGVLENPLRLAHFMAQAAHESGGFRYMVELWGPTDAQRRYEGRTDLGNTVPGDGSLYRGRGIFQLTGRANYRAFGKALELDLEAHPELAALPDNAVRIAAFYWYTRGINGLADEDNLEAVTRRINGGQVGLDDRRARLAVMKQVCGI